MTMLSWLNLRPGRKNVISSRNLHRGKNREANRPKSRRPWLELLEDRLAPAVFTVDTLSDTTGNTLRAAILAAETAAADSNGDRIVFTGAATSGTITLNSPLPPIYDVNALSIAGPGAANLTISGADQYRVFFILVGTVSISDVTVAHGRAHGGNGGTGVVGGGGGAGIGGGLLINSGSVTLANVVFASNQAVGGSGGISTNGNCGGGGGAGGNGGDARISGGAGGGGFAGDGGNGGVGSGGGGGGFTGNGGAGGALDSNGNPGSAVGGGGGGGGVGERLTFLRGGIGSTGGGNGGDSYIGGAGGGGGGSIGFPLASSGSDGAPYSSNGGGGGRGGFGGGGGGGSGNSGGNSGDYGGGAGGVSGGIGGFGGGGGAGDAFGGGSGGIGGFGGGGGAGGVANSGIGGLGGTFGGNGGALDFQGGGGGGAGLGGAIFLRAGSLTLSNTSFTNSSATGGPGGGTGATGGQGKAGALFIYSGATAVSLNTLPTFSGNLASDAANAQENDLLGTLTVISAAPTVTGRTNISATAGAPFSGVVGSFVYADSSATPASFSATITWGDGNTSSGIITANVSGGFNVSGSNTFADPGTAAIQVKVTVLSNSASATANSTATVVSLEAGVQDDQTKASSFWHNKKGQSLIRSFNGSESATGLANWLALSFPNLYGAGAGTQNLFGKTNADVAALFQDLWSLHHGNLDVQVLTTALNVYATTQSLGGAAAQSYGFRVTAEGLGASSFNVKKAGAAFGVADNSTLNVYQLLRAINRKAVNGVLYNGDAKLSNMAEDLLGKLNKKED